MSFRLFESPWEREMWVELSSGGACGKTGGVIMVYYGARQIWRHPQLPVKTLGTGWRNWPAGNTGAAAKRNKCALF